VGRIRPGSRPYQDILDKGKKSLPGTNALGYLASSSLTKKKSFVTLSPDDRPVTLAQSPTAAMMDS